MIKVNKNYSLRIYDSQILIIGYDILINLNILNNLQIMQNNKIVNIKSNCIPDCVMVHHLNKDWYKEPLYKHVKQQVDQFNNIGSSCPIVWLKGKYKNVTTPFDGALQFQRFMYASSAVRRFLQITKALKGGTVLSNDGSIAFLLNDNQIAAKVRPVMVKG